MLKFNRLVQVLAVAGLASAFATGATAGTTTGDITVSTTLVSACEVTTSSAAIAFGSVTALLSSGNKAANSGSGFSVACSSDLSPKIYSDTARTMTDGTNNLDFDLCLAACDGSNGLGADSGSANTLSITQNGSPQPVALHGRITAANFKALPAGAYTKIVTVSVDY